MMKEKIKNEIILNFFVFLIGFFSCAFMIGFEFFYLNLLWAIIIIIITTFIRVLIPEEDDMESSEPKFKGGTEVVRSNE